MGFATIQSVQAPFSGGLGFIFQVQVAHQQSKDILPHFFATLKFNMGPWNGRFDIRFHVKLREGKAFCLFLWLKRI